MKVSVIINNYNYGRYLGRAIESALLQTHNPTEVIVVDDGSTDNSREIIEGYKEDLGVVYKENGGQASAMNAGFEASSGNLVLFLDADDYLKQEAVERAVSVWAPGVAKVQFRLQCVDETGEPLGDFVKPRWEKSLPSGRVEEQIRESGDYVTAPTSGNVFSRDALQEIFPIPAEEWRLCADAYLYLNVPFRGTVQSIDSTLGYYRIHGTNAWQSGSVEPSKLIQRVQVHLQKQELVAKLIGRNLERRSPIFPDLNFARDRIATLLICPGQHPVSGDSRLDAIWYGVRSAFTVKNVKWSRRIKQLIGYIGIGIMPRSIVRPIIRQVIL